MKIRVWGARGSIPVCGAEYLKYGGDSTCLEVATAGGDLVILDAGTGLRQLGNRLLAEGRKDIHFLLTHAHWDHLLGFPFFKPLYRPGVTLHFHGCTFAQESIKTILRETMRAPFFPVDLNEVAATLVFDDECRPDFEVAGLCCQSFPLTHPNQGYGFILSEGAARMAFFPDNELGGDHFGGKSVQDYVDFVAGVDLLFHDGEYLAEEYERFARNWGHSVYLETVRLGMAARVGKLVLWHLNQERTDEQADAMLAEARKAIDNAGSPLDCDMAATGMTLEL